MKRLFISVAIAGLIALIAATLSPAQEKQDPEAMMKAYLELVQPGEPHKMLAGMEGKWDYVMKSYEDPEHPMEIQGKATMSMVMGGRFLMQETEATMMGLPFTGNGLTGFNNTTKEYESIWYDNMSTGIMKSVGSAEGNVITLWSEHIDPMTGQRSKVKTVSELVSEDKHLFTWYMIEGDQEIKAFEITYTRAE